MAIKDYSHEGQNTANYAAARFPDAPSAEAQLPRPESLEAFMSGTQGFGLSGAPSIADSGRVYSPFRKQYAHRGYFASLDEEAAPPAAQADAQRELTLRLRARDLPGGAVAFLIRRLDAARHAPMAPQRDGCAALVDADAWLADRPSPSPSKHDWIGALRRPFVPPA